MGIVLPQSMPIVWNVWGIQEKKSISVLPRPAPCGSYDPIGEIKSSHRYTYLAARINDICKTLPNYPLVKENGS
jgi:hypothetical protein